MSRWNVIVAQPGAQLVVKSARYCGQRRDFWLEARRVEQLPNGMWRADYSSGTVEMFVTRPATAERWHSFTRETI